MFFSDKIKLRAVVNGVDANGYPTQTNTDTEVWANCKSATRAEFYSANANGIDVSKMFEVHAEDWGNQTQVVYNSRVYDIIRAFQKGLGVVELTCSDRAV
ncbi:MAG TPA: phage head closure protein [Spirochaetia bacterium]|nr:phage head closure protein [Spirochaetia bacterium]